MQVNEIFYSINGESARAGLPTIFIRTYGCNLRCSYCFGVKPGRRVPRLRRAYQHYPSSGSHDLSLTDVKQGDWIMTYDDNMDLVETEVTSVTKRKVTEWYEVVIDNVVYFITPEHPVFTINGLKRVSELQVGDFIIECDSHKFMSYFALTCNCMHDPDVASQNAASHNYKEQGKLLKETYSRIKEEINQLLENQVPMKDWPDSCISNYNKWHRERTEEERAKISERMKGEKNPNYNPDSIHRPNFESLKQAVREGKITRSQLSGKTLEENDAKRFIVHHIDGNNTNDSWDNLIVVTSREHNQIHQRGYSFWKSERKDGKRLSRLVDNNGKEVQEIKHIDIAKHPHFGRSYGPKSLTVYTLSCAPYNTYLIDNMWVHNCDTPYSWEGSGFQTMSVNEILNQLSSYKCKRVTLTGGEPMLQSDAVELVTKLLKGGYQVEIETNGAVKLDELVHLRDLDNVDPSALLVTMDWKCTTSNESNKMLDSNLELLSAYDVLKCVVGSSDDLEQMKDLYGRTLARIYASPVFGMIEPKDIVSYILDNDLTDITMQLQQHKIIWPPDMRGV